MNALEIEALLDDVADVMKTLVAEAVTPLSVRLDEIEAKARSLDGSVAAAAASELVPEIAALRASLGDIAEAAAAKKIEALPKPKDGDPGRDGVGLTGALIDREGNLCLTLSDGTMKTLGRVIGKDGDAGRDGKDGLSFEDFNFDVEHDGERVFTLKWSNAGKEIVKRFGVPAMIYRGVFKEGETYRSGDIVTWGGSLWHCREETTQKPLDNAAAWQLAAKRGRDGKPGPVQVARPDPQQVARK